MSDLREETVSGLRHGASLVRRWWLLLLMCGIFGLGLGALVVKSNPASHRSDVVVLVRQPAVDLDPALGQASSEHVVELLPTIALLAVRDDVLADVAKDMGFDGDADGLRSHIRTSVIAQTLTFRIEVTFAKRDQAVAATDSLIARLPAELETLATGKTAAPLAMDVLQTDVQRVNQNGGRTLALSTIIGFGFALLTAAVLDRG